MAILSDGELVAACLQGESKAWEALVDRYKRLVYSVALRAGLTPEDAEDAFQTVFTRLIEHLANLREPQGLAAWLITTTKHASWRLAEQRSREQARPFLPDEEWFFSPQPEEPLWADQALVRDAVEQVGERCKQLLLLLYYDPQSPSYENISQRLRMPLGSIGPTRARCLSKLRSLLQAMGL